MIQLRMQTFENLQYTFLIQLVTRLGLRLKPYTYDKYDFLNAISEENNNQMLGIYEIE